MIINRNTREQKSPAVRCEQVMNESSEMSTGPSLRLQQQILQMQRSDGIQLLKSLISGLFGRESQMQKLQDEFSRKQKTVLKGRKQS